MAKGIVKNFPKITKTTQKTASLIHEKPRGSGRWYVFIDYDDGQQIRRTSRHAGTQKAALEAARKIQALPDWRRMALQDDTFLSLAEHLARFEAQDRCQEFLDRLEEAARTATAFHLSAPVGADRPCTVRLIHNDAPDTILQLDYPEAILNVVYTLDELTKQKCGAR